MSLPVPIPLGPIQVNSLLFLKVFVRSQRCACGSTLEVREEATRERGAAKIRTLIAVCSSCRLPHTFEFDVTRLKTGDRCRFLETVTRFLDGMTALKKEDLPSAERHFADALDPEGGEPNFSIAHYYLGQAAMKSGRADAAIARFGRASALQPMELSYRDALYRAHRLNGDDDNALAALAALEDVRLRIGHGAHPDTNPDTPGA